MHARTPSANGLRRAPGEASLDGETFSFGSVANRPVHARSGDPDRGGGRDATRSWRSFDRMLLRAAPLDRGVFNRVPSLRRGL
jgi:hypothetical protein